VSDEAEEQRDLLRNGCNPFVDGTGAAIWYLHSRMRFKKPK